MTAAKADPTEVATDRRSVKFNSAEDVAELVEAINSCSNLVTINLEGNSYGVEAARALAEALSTAGGSLRHLRLNDMFISRLKDEIPAALELLFGAIHGSGAQIETLNLSDNAIGPVTMPALTPFLSSPACTSSLRVLHLNNAGLGTRGGAMLSAVLGGLEQLQELAVGRNRLELDGMRDISCALEQLHRMEVLQLYQNGTRGVAAVEALVRALRANAATLRVLNFNDNVLTKRKGALMAEAVAGLKRLQVLNLGDCLLGTANALALFGALQTLASSAGVHFIRELVLSGNNISSRNAEHLGETIIATVEALLATRASPSTPLRLDLSSNNLGEELIGRLQAAFADPEVVELLLADDEGSEEEDEGVEDGEEEEEEDGEEAKENGAGGDDDVQEASPLKNGDKQSKRISGQPATLESLMAKHEAAFTSLEELAGKYFWVASKGLKTAEEAGGHQLKLTDRAKLELEALIKVGLAHQSPSAPMELANALLVACGLIKAEDRRLAPPKDADLRGALFALAGALKIFSAQEPKSAVKALVLRALETPAYEPLKSAINSVIYSF